MHKLLHTTVIASMMALSTPVSAEVVFVHASFNFGSGGEHGNPVVNDVFFGSPSNVWIIENSVGACPAHKVNPSDEFPDYRCGPGLFDIVIGGFNDPVRVNSLSFTTIGDTRPGQVRISISHIYDVIGSSQDVTFTRSVLSPVDGVAGLDRHFFSPIFSIPDNVGNFLESEIQIEGMPFNALYFNNFTFEVETGPFDVPEPSALGMLGLGASLLIARYRRRDVNRKACRFDEDLRRL